MSKFRFIPYAVLTAGGVLAASGAANAQPMYEINQRQDYQQNRIEQGVRRGQISRSEAARLEQGERAIDYAQRRASADGRVTSEERARLDRMANREGREIFQQSHDRQQSWDRGQDCGRTDGRAHDGWNDRDGSGRGGDNRGGWGHRDADRRDWGRDHNNGSWNQGRDHNGWNHSGNRGNGGWPRGGATTPTTPSTGGSAVANNTGNRIWGNWGGQTRPVGAPPSMSAPTRNFATANTGARSSGGRGFGGGHR